MSNTDSCSPPTSQRPNVMFFLQLSFLWSTFPLTTIHTLLLSPSSPFSSALGFSVNGVDRRSSLTEAIDCACIYHMHARLFVELKFDQAGVVKLPSRLWEIRGERFYIQASRLHTLLQRGGAARLYVMCLLARGRMRTCFYALWPMCLCSCGLLVLLLPLFEHLQ
jgi:hypothetical protein